MSLIIPHDVILEETQKKVGPGWKCSHEYDPSAAVTINFTSRHVGDSPNILNLGYVLMHMEEVIAVLSVSDQSNYLTNFESVFPILIAMRPRNRWELSTYNRIAEYLKDRGVKQLPDDGYLLYTVYTKENIVNTHPIIVENMGITPEIAVPHKLYRNFRINKYEELLNLGMLVLKNNMDPMKVMSHLIVAARKYNPNMCMTQEEVMAVKKPITDPRWYQIIGKPDICFYAISKVEAKSSRILYDVIRKYIADHPKDGFDMSVENILESIVAHVAKKYEYDLENIFIRQFFSDMGCTTYDEIGDLLMTVWGNITSTINYIANIKTIQQTIITSPSLTLMSLMDELDKLPWWAAHQLLDMNLASEDMKLPLSIIVRTKAMYDRNFFPTRVSRIIELM